MIKKIVIDGKEFDIENPNIIEQKIKQECGICGTMQLKLNHGKITLETDERIDAKICDDCLGKYFMKVIK